MNHLRDYFSQFRIRWSDSGYHRMINPMDSSRHYNMVVNFTFNFCQDWKTGYYNSIAGFISDFSGCPISEAIDFVGEIYTPLLSGVPDPQKVEKLSGVALPDDWQDLNHDSIMGKRCRDYLATRKLDLNACIKAGWGFCDAGPFIGRLILPYTAQGKLVYYSGRSFIGGSPKYKNPNTEEVGVGKSELFYNQDALYRYSEGWLVEGVIDAFTIGKNAIAASGWKLSATQISVLAKSRWKILNIVPDEGFEMEALSTGLYFKDIMKVHIHKIPEGGKDVNKIGFKNIILNPKSL